MIQFFERCVFLVFDESDDVKCYVEGVYVGFDGVRVCYI